MYIMSPLHDFLESYNLSSPLPTSPNHYMICLDPIPLAVVEDYLNIAYIRFQVGINDLNNSEAKSVTSKAVISPSYKEALQTIFFFH